MEKCIARGPGWKCDREQGDAGGWCVGHYGQARRDGDENLRPLKDAHGKSVEERVKISFDAPVKDVATVRAEAKKRGGKTTPSDVFREALAAFAAKLRGKG